MIGVEFQRIITTAMDALNRNSGKRSLSSIINKILKIEIQLNEMTGVGRSSKLSSDSSVSSSLLKVRIAFCLSFICIAFQCTVSWSLILKSSFLPWFWNIVGK